MGDRGPAPTPTRILQMRGTYRKDRHGDPAQEPDVELIDQLPNPPHFFDQIAAFEWHRIGPELIEKQLLARVDLAAFTLYCLSVARVAKCEQILQEKGMTMITFGGVECARPEVAIARQCGAEVRRFAQEFGMTPSARRRVSAPPQKKPEKAATGWGKVKGA